MKAKVLQAILGVAIGLRELIAARLRANRSMDSAPSYAAPQLVFTAAASPVSVRNATSGQIANGSATVTLPTRSAGDILVVYIGMSGTPPTAGTGWTRQFSQQDGYLGQTAIACYTKVSDGTDSTGPLSATLPFGGAFCCASLQNPASGVDQAGSAQSTGGTQTNVVAPSVTNVGSADVLISGYMAQFSNTITLPGGQTAVGPAADSGAQVVLKLGYETLVAAGATGTRTATISMAAGWAAGTLTVQ